jgi:hypothetical protein
MTASISRLTTTVTNGVTSFRIESNLFRNGVIDQPTFDRMVKRRCGVTPGEARLR